MTQAYDETWGGLLHTAKADYCNELTQESEGSNAFGVYVNGHHKCIAGSKLGSKEDNEITSRFKQMFKQSAQRLKNRIGKA